MAEIKENNEQELVTTERIQSLIYTMRNLQVMVDSDLAFLYGVETRTLNQAVKRNKARFPERYCFQLSKEEYENLKSQNVISSSDVTNNGYGGRRTCPFVYTEQGIAMLSSVLKSEAAVSVSIRIMDVFVEMRRFIAANSLLFEKISNLELKQLVDQKHNDENFEKIFAYIEKNKDSMQAIFFDGQMYDAHSFIINLIQKAANNIKLIDGYVSVETLDMLSRKQQGVDVTIYTLPNAQISNRDIKIFNAQYPNLVVKRTNAFHDRFLILDDSIVYQIGASIKDVGKKCFGVSLFQEQAEITSLLTRLSQIV